ncbi:MAG: tetratricopeptide repeat protein [Ginsengibacter sp.]
MNTNKTILPEEFQEIEQYILNKMSREQLQSFTQRLNSDGELRNKVHYMKLLLTGIQEDQLARDLNKFHDNMQSPPKNISPKENGVNLKFLLIAASVIFLVTISIFLFLNNPQQEEKLYSEFYKPDSGLISSMSSSEHYSFDRAMIDYKTEDYKAAIQIWDTLYTIKPGNDTLQYFLGSAYLALNQYENAITYFEKVISQENSYFVEDANWYLGLALLKINKKDQAISFIEKSDHPQKEKILDKLKK